MTITIHQAICGEQNKAWDLIKTTLDDQAIGKKIAFKTDLQDSPPSGVNWSPAIRGFLYDGFYLIIKTYLDTSDNVRNGRVFSHCLIIEKDDLHKLNDISDLFQLFKPEMDKEIFLEPIAYKTGSKNAVKLETPEKERFNKIVQNFLSLEECHNTIIWVGKDGYQAIVQKFWQLLDDTQKLIFNFGINFNPNEVPKNKINLVLVPENIEVKFENRGYCLIKKDEVVMLSEFSEQYLAGDERAQFRLEEFAKAFEFENFTLKDVSIIAKGVKTFEEMPTIGDVKVLNTYTNIVAKYSPDPNKGTGAKSKLLTYLCSKFKVADSKEIFLLKNFPVQSFKNSQNQITATTTEWIEKHVLLEKKNSAENGASIGLQIFNSTTPNWWTGIFLSIIKDYFSKTNKDVISLFWSWIVNEHEILNKVFPFLSTTKGTEKILIETFPKNVPKNVMGLFRPMILTLGWYKLHAVLLKREFDFNKAIAEQLLVDMDVNHFDGIQEIIEGVPAKDVIEFAVKDGNERILTIASKLIRPKTKELDEIKIENLNWQKLWLKTIQNKLPLTNGLSEPQKAVFAFFDAIVKGKPYELGLLEAIGETEFSNILKYPKRNFLWNKLPVSIKEKFLVKTSGIFLEELSKNSAVSVPVDKELSNYIRSNAIGTFLYYNRNNLKSALPIFVTYTELPESSIKNYIDNYVGSLDVVDAVQLGKLALKHSYIELAYSIYHKASYIKNFKVALGECYNLLDLITRGIAWAKGSIVHIVVSPDEWWSSFVELCYKLYSSGPMENKIWKQSSGEEYDLLTKGTGKEVWISALQKLRNGGCTGITVKKLLKKMIAEHKNTPELIALKDLYKKI